MIIENKTGNEVVVEGESHIKQATISGGKLKKLQYILTRGLYSDAIGAVIVEITNNAIDSVVSSGKDIMKSPVIVEIGNKKNGAYFFRVEDKGIGLDKNGFENVLMCYLESTKEEDGDAIGHFGLGSKSFLSLDRPATFTCRKGGMEYKYLAYQGVEFCEYDLLYEKETKEEDGVIFEIEMKGWNEKYTFEQKARKKLAYYDNVALIIDGVMVENTIYRENDFQWSNNSSSREMHICLKDVYYEIDWNKLGISSINCPIALRFGLGDGLVMVPSRESLIYTEEVKKIILKKIKETADWFMKKYNSSVKEFDNFVQAIPYFRNRNKIVVLNEQQIDIEGLIKYMSGSLLPIKVKGLGIWEPEKWWRNLSEVGKNFELVAILQGNGKITTKRMYGDLLYSINQKDTPILVEKAPVGRMKGWMVKRYSRNACFFHEKKMELHNYKARLRLLDLPKKDWRPLIKECQELYKQLREFLFKDEREASSTKEFIKYCEEQLAIARASRGTIANNYKTLDKQEGEITIAYAREPKMGVDGVFEKETYVIKDLYKQPFISVMFTEDQKEEAKKYYGLHDNLRVAIIGKREQTRLPKLKSFMKKEELEKTKLFKRIVTAIRAGNIIERWETINSSGNEIVRKCLDKVSVQLEILEKYVKDNERRRYLSTEEMASFLLIAEEHNLWDEEILHIIRKLEDSFKPFYFLQYIEFPNYGTEEDKERVKRLINQLLLFQKKYGALENYDLVEKAQPEEYLDEQLQLEEEFLQTPEAEKVMA